MWQDLRYSFRSTVQQPLFAAVAATVLALGVGLNTAVFSVVSALLFRPLPIQAPEELVYIYRAMPRQPERPIPIPPRTFDYLREHNEAFAGLSGTWRVTIRVTAGGETDEMRGEMVQPGYFEVLGVAGPLGRALVASDHDPAATEPAIVISHDFWMRRFDGDSGILGTRVRLVEELEHDFTIVGVAPPGFTGVADPWTPSHFWAPASVVERQVLNAPDGVRVSFLGVARLRPDVGLSQARAIVDAQARQHFPEGPDGQARLMLFPTSGVRMPYDPTNAVIPTRLASALGLVVLMVLLIAVSNVAGVLMARGVSRSSEIALRRVLGAGGARIARQLMTEGLLLAAAGGVAGLLLAQWLVALFHALTPLKYSLDASIDWRAALFAIAACAMCGVLVGLAPAVQAIRLNILPALANAGATTTRQTRRRLRHAVVLPQVALSLVLLLVAGVYVRALMRVELADPGYDASNVVVVSTMLRNLPGAGPGGTGAGAEAQAERARRYYHQLVARLDALPGIVAGASYWLPLHAPSTAAQSRVTTLEEAGTGAGAHAAMLNGVSPGYFQAVGMRILRGRDFDGRDTPSAPRAGIISASLAAQLWPGEDAVGRTASIVTPSPGRTPQPFEVVGVVNEVHPVLHDTGQSPYVYFAMGQGRRPYPHFVVARGVAGAAGAQFTIRQVREAVAAADPLAESFGAGTLDAMIAEILYPRRLAAAVLFASGWIALLLASVGIYGVISYSVAQRLGEIGIRRALGADGHDIARLVIGEGLKVAAIGSVAGLVLAYAAIRVTSSRFLALPQLDIMTLIVVPLVLAVVVVLACAVPARRATRVDPLEVLRRT